MEPILSNFREDFYNAKAASISIVLAMEEWASGYCNVSLKSRNLSLIFYFYDCRYSFILSVSKHQFGRKFGAVRYQFKVENTRNPLHDCNSFWFLSPTCVSPSPPEAPLASNQRTIDDPRIDTNFVQENIIITFDWKYTDCRSHGTVSTGQQLEYVLMLSEDSYQLLYT